MKIKEFIAPSTVIFLIIIVVNSVLNLFFGIRPIVEYFNYLEKSHFFIGIPLSFFIPILIVHADRVRHRNIVKQKIELFKTTIHTIQDILNNFAAKTQLLVMDLEENNVDKNIVENAQDIFKESQELIKLLSSIDPLKTEITELNEKVHVFKITNRIILSLTFIQISFYLFF